MERLRVHVHHRGSAECALARCDEWAIADDGVGDAGGRESSSGVFVCVLKDARGVGWVCGFCAVCDAGGGVLDSCYVVARGGMGEGEGTCGVNGRTCVGVSNVIGFLLLGCA